MYKKFIKKGAAGYMTLEAAFIIPWVIFLFVFLIYTGFYFYDKCVLFQDIYALGFRGSIQKEENTALDYINAHMKEQFGSKYFGVGKVQGSVVKQGQEIKVYGTCTVKIPFHHFFTMADKSGWKIETEAKAKILNPTRIIRKCRMAESLLQELQTGGM